MSARPWYKRYAADFVHGALGLTLEEKGAYSLCLDLIYDKGGPIPDDPRWLAGVCGVSVRKWKALRARLIDKGKLTAKGGALSNLRAEKEIEKAREAARKLAENGAKGGHKAAEKRAATSNNNYLGAAPPQHRARGQKPEARDQKDIVGSAPGELDDLEARLARAAGDSLNRTTPALADLSRPLAWLAAGCDLGADILPTVGRLARTRPAGSIASWKYFEQAVMDARAARLAPVPEGRARDNPDRPDRPDRYDRIIGVDWDELERKNG